MRELEKLQDQLEVHEIQEKLNDHTLDDEASKLMQIQAKTTNLKSKVQVEANKRYSKLLALEEQNDFVQQSMAEKTKLVKNKKDLESLIEVRKERNTLLENFMS